MESHIRRLQRKYCNPVCSHSDIRQECLLKLHKVTPKIKPGMSMNQIYAYLIRCLETHLIDTTMKFRSCETRSRKVYNKLREERPWQFVDKGSQVGVRRIWGQEAIQDPESHELNTDFQDALDWWLTPDEVTFFQDYYIDGLQLRAISRVRGTSLASSSRLKWFVDRKLRHVFEDIQWTW